jgi:glycine hydroxymethyltransferase
MKENEMKKIAGFINNAINNFDKETELDNIKKGVKELCAGFPLYSQIN